MTSVLKNHRALVALILIALLLRLALVLVLDPSPDFSGGDTGWYMENGRDLVLTGKTAGPLPTAPLYPVFVGIVQAIIPGQHSSGERYAYADMQTVRVIQAALGAMMCLFVFVLGSRLIARRAGWIAAYAAALSPALILEAGHVATEQMFLFLMLGALAYYATIHAQSTSRTIALVGAMLGLATLTRAVFLLFPLGIVLHLFLTHRVRWLRLSVALLVTYGAIVSTWTVYNLIVWDRFVIGGEGLLSFVHQGAEGKASPEEYDASLGVTGPDDSANRQDRIRSGIRDNVLEAPLSWAAHRVKELVAAYLQPHNTNYFPGASIRDAAQDWLRDDRTLRGLRDLTRIEAFWPKLALYLFHFAGLLLGGLGMLALRRRWRDLLPLHGVILYFTAIHFILLALPRYLFPMYPIFGIFAASVLSQVWGRLTARRSHTPSGAQ